MKDNNAKLTDKIVLEAVPRQKQDKLCPNYLVKGARKKSETDFSKYEETTNLKQESTGMSICGIEKFKADFTLCSHKKLDSERGNR